MVSTAHHTGHAWLNGVFGDEPATIRRLFLVVYLVAMPCLLASIWIEADAARRDPAVVAGALLMTLAIGLLWLRPSPGTAGWALLVGVIPAAACAIGLEATEEWSAAYLVVLGSPVAIAAVLFETPVVVVAFVSSVVVTVLGTPAPGGPWDAVAHAMLFAGATGIVAVMGHGAATAQRIARVAAETSAAALAASELRYRTLFENLQEDMSVYRVARDTDGHVIDWILLECNASGRAFFKGAYASAVGRPLADSLGVEMARRQIGYSERALAGETISEEVYFEQADTHFQTSIFALDADTIVDASFDVTARVRSEQALRDTLAENAFVMTELREALASVRTLSGMLPICSYCKRIRDDDGYWDRIERYISAHSQAQFSHGMCPDCFREHALPELEALDARDGAAR